MSVDKWEQRMLCPDGACVGVIGMNGQCKVCGTAVPDWGDPRKPGRVSSKAEDEAEPEAPEEDDDDLEEDEDEAEAADEPAKAKGADDGEEQRRLCPDGSCIGLIGDDDTCKVCGKAADPNDDSDDEEDDDEHEDDEEEEETEDVAETKKDDDAQDRALCSDGACVGVIGIDGKCKVCGKAAA